MIRKFTALFLALTMIFTLAACGQEIGEIAGNVANAAKQELEKQIAKVLEKYKITPIEIKSAVGKLNDTTDSNAQFFCAALIQSNSDVLPRACASALGRIFDAADVHLQTESRIDNLYLVHKSITFDHTDFESSNYYVLWVYTASFKELLPDTDGLSSITDMLGLDDITSITDLPGLDDVAGMIDMDGISSFGGVG